MPPHVDITALNFSIIILSLRANRRKTSFPLSLLISLSHCIVYKSLLKLLTSPDSITVLG